MKKMLLETECGYFHGNNKLKTLTIVLELLNTAVNAIIAKQAAEARQLLAAEALAQCRQETNPYLPTNNLFGPTRQQMWGPDPCLQQQEELAQADLQLRQISNMPTLQNIGAQPAPQLSSTLPLDQPSPIDPALPISETVTPDPQQESMWSPSSIESTMNKIWDQLQQVSPGSVTSQSIEEEMEIVYQQLVILMSWCPEKPPVRQSKFLYDPKNKDWINSWVPK